MSSHVLSNLMLQVSVQLFLPSLLNLVDGSVHLPSQQHVSDRPISFFKPLFPLISLYPFSLLFLFLGSSYLHVMYDQDQFIINMGRWSVNNMSVHLKMYLPFLILLSYLISQKGLPNVWFISHLGILILKTENCIPTLRYPGSSVLSQVLCFWFQL